MNTKTVSEVARPWDKIISHVTVPDAKAAPFVIEKREGAFVLSKEWDPQNQKAVWTKTYQPKSAQTTGDLSFLCEWEIALLTRANQSGVRRCVHLIATEFEPSPMHLPDTPENKRVHRSSRLRTLDAGPTLDVWRLMRPRVDGRVQAHPFVEQRNYLQLVRGILSALEDFHANGFVHCDLHPGNIALPVRQTKVETDSVRGNYIQLEPVWDDIRIIDLDFSACGAIAPPIRLPHQLTELGAEVSPMSDHLRLRLVAIDKWLQSQNKQDRCYDREFWAKAPQSEQLQCFQSLDWREDLYQLGYWLAYIRDQWGGAAYVNTTGDNAEVNRFINTFPEELMQWGSAKQIDWDPVNPTSKRKALVLPHDSYLARIDSLLRQASNEHQVFVLRQADHDPQYQEAKRMVGVTEKHYATRAAPGMPDATRNAVRKFLSRDQFKTLAAGTGLLVLILATVLGSDWTPTGHGWSFASVDGASNTTVPASKTLPILQMRTEPEVKRQEEKAIKPTAERREPTPDPIVNRAFDTREVRSTVAKSSLRQDPPDIVTPANRDVPPYPRYHLYGFSHDDEVILASTLRRLGVQAADVFLERSAEAGGLSVSINLIAANDDHVEDHFDVPVADTATAISRWLSDHLK